MARRESLQGRPFLRRVYAAWYRQLLDALPAGPGEVVEIGSGPGFLAEVLPGLITSDALPLLTVKAVIDGCELPFRNGSLRAIVMTDVLHHVARVGSFLAESARCLRPGGVVAMVEPWCTAWSRFVYRRLHHEPFEPAAPSWEIAAGGPLSGANAALPWIVFARDRRRFEADFPLLAVRRIVPMMPFCYLLSGGFSMGSLLPGWSFPAVRRFEKALGPLEGRLAMFALIVLERTPDHPRPADDGGAA